MHPARILSRTALAFCAGLLLPLTAADSRPQVHLERVPNDGLQPQAVVDAAGATHLVWLGGDAKAADVFYATRPAGHTDWSPPLRVNSGAGSAIAVGTIRGAQIALGRKGRVHVCWNGSDRAEPKPAQGGAPLMYARLADDRRTFESQRNLLGPTRHLDGGAAVAADADGRVFVIWHATPATGEAGEVRRAVFVAASTDDGSHFATERIISPPGSGACGCCGLQAQSSPNGTLAVLYRGATAVDARPINLLVSSDHGAAFHPVMADPWNVGQCPMSSAGLSLPDGKGLLAAWESSGKIHWQRLSAAPPKSPEAARPHIIAGDKSLKHPVLATNRRQETLVAWTIGTGWQRGGSLAWRIIDAQDKTIAEGNAPGVPVWGSLAAVAGPDETFTLLY